MPTRGKWTFKLQHPNHRFYTEFAARLSPSAPESGRLSSWCETFAVIALALAFPTFLFLHLSIASLAAVVCGELGVAYLVVCLRDVRGRAACTERLARALLSTDANCLKLLDFDGRIVCISEVGQQLMQAGSPDQLLGKNWLAFWSTSEAGTALRTAMNGQMAEFTGSCETLDGKCKWWHSTLAPVRASDGAVVAAFCTSRDVTAGVTLLSELRHTADLQRDMEDHVDAVFWTASSDFKSLHHVSSGFERMWEMPLSALSEDKTAWARRVHSDDLLSLRNRMRSVVHEASNAQEYFRLVFGGERIKWVRADIYPVVVNGGVTRIVSVCVDATIERQRLRELERMARADNLTGLCNRKAMADALASSCEIGAPFAFLFIDLDRFKVVNDTEGHATGDSVLKALGSRIREALPSNATVARPGGDEFTVILPGRWDAQGIQTIGQRLIASCQRPMLIGPRTVTMTFSVGAAFFPEHGDSPEALFTSADLAMYAAKRSGRSCFRLFGPSEQGELKRAHLEHELQKAVQLGQFVLHYQPQFCTRTRLLRGVEALIRWDHPLVGLIGPELFVPILEESGLIVEVGHWVIWQSIAALATLDSLRAGQVSMSINVSAKQFKDSELVGTLRKSLAEHGVSGSRLILEITESTLMESVEPAQDVLEPLRNMGLRIAIDDFGTGYSSLSYLTSVRPDALKLDKALLDEVVANRAARTVVDAVIDLAHKLGITVVAEGVENEAQMAILVAAECDETQGFLLSKPLSFDALVRRFGSVIDGAERTSSAAAQGADAGDEIHPVHGANVSYRR
ncbi:EAL domain-containing protein [Caballeronia sp. LjRoot29]